MAKAVFAGLADILNGCTHAVGFFDGLVKV
jgi:hypothetical protein